MTNAIELKAPVKSETLLMQSEKELILSVLTKKLGNNFFYGVNENTSCFGGHYLKIWVSTSLHQINGVSGQMPDVISFCLESDLILKPQSYGCMGGGSFYIKPDLTNPAEKYLAMKSVKIPFRTPKQDMSKVVACFSKVLDNYISLMKEYRSRLLYSQYVDYDAILG